MAFVGFRVHTITWRSTPHIYFLISAYCHTLRYSGSDHIAAGRSLHIVEILYSKFHVLASLFPCLAKQ